MAEELYDGEFWLPPEFLTDDDLLMDFKSKGNGGFSLSLGFNGNSSGFNSDLSSPVESVNGSTETESDEDEYLTEVTRQLFHSSLRDSKSPFENPKRKVLSGSPQSTLCGAFAGRGSNFGSSRASPNGGASRVSSPPGIKRSFASDWDMLYEAAGEVARMRLIEEAAGFYTGNRGVHNRVSNPNPNCGSVFNQNCGSGFNPNCGPGFNPNCGSGFYPNQAAQLSYRQLQLNQFEQLKQQQMMKQKQSGYPQMITNVRRNGTERANPQSQALSMAAWPTLQQSQRQPRTGMTAMFLGDTAAVKRERCGTGVFLPRRFGAPTEARKKPGCSTVLLPDRVVHALNLNLDNPPQLPSGPTSSFTPDRVANNYTGRNNVLTPQELRLPQEWTY